ncbi:arylesterase [Epibacterium sp. MM17-32]|uniref:arylesterase n=1 Tax=Epibacterium sp. MM17-32 TaxID=2917734 RepID=UPI001EF41393|nr:arylesterase [Epibacterium sp. MM17-32]MCG7629207.1 arylesterase [Epibacterium sp. MM17-32]
MRKFLGQIAASFATILALTQFAWAEPIRLTAFGDSLVQGYGLAQEDGFVPQLEAWLRDQGHAVSVSNAGVSGDTTTGGAARIDWSLADDPDGVIVLLGGNDLLRGLPPQETRANLAQIITASRSAGAEVLLIGMQAPGNYGADYKEDFDRIYPELAAAHDVVLHPSAFAGIMSETDGDPSRIAEFLQADGIHPNARGVALNVAALGPKVLDLIRRINASDNGVDG